MSKHYSSGKLLTAVRIGLLASLFMPLIISGNYIFPYIFPKQAFFQILVEAVFVMYIFLAFKDPQYRPRSSWLFKALLGYFAVMVLASVFGVNTYHSFWSNYERMAGVVSLFHYLGFLFVAANVFKTKPDWFRFFDVSILVSVLEGLYGLGQMAGVFNNSSGARIDGTIGNTSFLAGYMLLNAFFALWLATQKKSRNWRIYYGAVIALSMLIIYQTQTRGAVLAFLAAVFCLAAMFAFAREKDLEGFSGGVKSLKKYALWGLVGFVVLVAALFAGRNTDFIKTKPTLERITHISLSEGTSETRLLAWKMSLKGIAEKPIFGWGPENYYVVFNKYYDPKLYPVESWFDRSHNAFLDVLVHTGIVGFAFYAAAAFLALWYLWKARREERIDYATAGIFSVLLLAYAIQNFFVFDTQVTLLLIYSILSFLVFLSFKSKPEEEMGKPMKPNVIFTVLIILVMVGFGYKANIKPALAASTAIKGIYDLQQSKIDDGLAKFKDALNIGTFGKPEVALRIEESTLNLESAQGVSDAKKKEFADVAVEGVKKALEMEPLNARFMMILVNFYLAAAETDQTYISQAEILLNRVQELSPTRQELYFYLAQLRYYQGRKAEVLPMMQKAVELNDKVAISHWNYGLMAIAVGDKIIGEQEVQKARDLGHSYNASDLEQLISAYKNAQDLPKVIALYQEYIQKYPNNAQPYAGLAAAYAQMGDKLKARDLALQAAQIDPNYQQETQAFIQQLGL